MPKPMTAAERDEFLAEVHVATISVTNEGDRPPHTVPVWYAYAGDRFYFFTGTQGRKARKTKLIRRSGTVTINVQNGQIPYKYLTAECAVESIDSPPPREKALAVAGRYLPREIAEGFIDSELARGESPFTLFTVRPDRWVSWDFADEER